ncbi:MAG: L,D-transpeptidase [Gammaproteobacteria bacterium]|nr:L,D-transpeptidase [Gammaproteobacteria bacterium]
MNQEIRISIADQRLQLRNNNKLVMDVMVATAKNGAGELFGSECTPRGKHRVRAMIGHGCAINTVFVARRPTGEIFSNKLRNKQPQRDWILTRILWLSGEEVGINRLGNVDTMRRYIYIHGGPDDQIYGKPNSHGCVRMKNSEVVALFNQVKVGVSVLILENKFSR